MDEEFEVWYRDWYDDNAHTIKPSVPYELKAFMWAAWEAGQQAQRDAHDLREDD